MIIPAARISGERVIVPREMGGRGMTVTKPMTIEEMNDVLFLLAEVDRLRQELQAAQAREAKAIGCIEDALEIAARWGLDLNMEPWAAISEARQALTTGEGGAGDV